MSTRIAYDVAENDREDLEGKIIDYTTDGKNGWKVLVVGVNRAVGVTLVHENDHENNCICFRGPVVSDPSDFEDDNCTWDEMYDAVVDMIEKGSVNPDALLALRHGNMFMGGECSAPCAYSQ